jgi:hypothetical protein
VRKLGVLLAIGNVALMVACGGGSSNSNNNNPTTTITSVTASCSPSTVQSGQTSQCSATVMGTGNFASTVTWAASVGQISSAGLLTAPVVSSTTNVTVTATSTQDPTKFGTATVTVNPTQSANNVAPIIVDAGPPALQNVTVANVPYVTVTVCVPGSTTQCQTIDHVTVDTGSSGLRIVSSVLNISLPQAIDSSGNPLDECLGFQDGYVWGPVATADITVAGETASNVPVQVMIPTTGNPPVPSSCSSTNTGPNEGVSVDAFGANALIGVGLFQQDCGPACTTQNSTIPDVYYDCPSTGCTPTYVTLAQQVANPVAMFATDNNGVLVQLPSVPNGGSTSASGFLIFGIGTQSNNALGTATVYPVPDTGSNAGNFTTIFNGTSYPGSFIDSGSNGLFFLNTTTTGIATCAKPDQSWYCPATSPDNLSAVNQGSNGQSGPATPFSIENAVTLFNNNSGNNTAFSTLGGPNPGSFDWGLSFFFGKNVFSAIENMGAPGGTPPYYAY